MEDRNATKRCVEMQQRPALFTATFRTVEGLDSTTEQVQTNNLSRVDAGPNHSYRSFEDLARQTLSLDKSKWLLQHFDKRML